MFRLKLVDLRSLSPIDTDTIFASVEKTHKVVVVQEAQKMAGVGAHVASEISEHAIMSLDAPIGRVAAPNSVYPFAQAENVWIPGVDEIEAKAREILDY
jgi:pyruvate dehydrogenase E1 component beta subunit